MERLNGEFRDREKVTRGLKIMDSPLIDGYQLYHNYIRPRMSLENRTPPPAKACRDYHTGREQMENIDSERKQRIKKVVKIGVKCMWLMWMY